MDPDGNTLAHFSAVRIRIQIMQSTALTAFLKQYFLIKGVNLRLIRTVWTKLKGSTLIIECGGEVIGRYKVMEERYQDILKNKL